ncbi:MAG: aminodeoxychorismate synthase component I [Campylobacteraceae bacterium]|nr:aminodeoxychorismate synthase component I [Campylobacteraceae bacterium]
MDEFREKLNYLGEIKKPFVFIIDFDFEEPIIEILPTDKLLFKINDYINYDYFMQNRIIYSLKPIYVSFEEYQSSFDKVIQEIKKGNTYLLNLTFTTKLDNKLNLEDIFYVAQSKFKLCLKDRFVCFSPERFIKIKDNKIQTHPMKGTVDANIKNAKNLLLEDEKEQAEHLMVVDLLRNDLSMVSKKVRVEKYRYIDKIKTRERELLQVSSKIVGDLEIDWQKRLGDIITTLLPAGSITGTPKKMTIEIIKKIENYKRGFYAGIFGYFDGKNLDSAVTIRYIEKQKDSFFYKSGGGVTLLSDVKKEYKEMCEKVYIPLS